MQMCASVSEDVSLVEEAKLQDAGAFSISKFKFGKV
jgi:hypothetical protein